MALVEKFHVVAAEQDVASGETIKEGQIVSINSSGEVVLQSATDSEPYGIAGDTKSTSASSMPGIASGWQNRVSDYFDETRASGKMTVYHSGGEFATDQFNANVSSMAVMDALYAVDGVLDNNTSQSSTVVGRITRLIGTTTPNGAYPSGVPGVDINGDQALSGENSNTYIEFKLLI
jgi:hypothetical protein